MSIDISRLGPDAQRQVLEQIAKAAKQRERRRQVLNPPKQFESNNERDFYLAEVYPGLQSGEILNCEQHKTFLLYPAMEYGGFKLPEAVFTPDFFLEYANGSTVVVETKGKTVRRLQRDFSLRRRIFFEKWLIPNKWIYREIIIDD